MADEGQGITQQCAAGGDQVEEGETPETTTPLTLGQIDGLSAQPAEAVQKNGTSAGGDTQRNTTSAKSGGDEVKEGVTSETTTPLTLGHAKDDQIDGVSAQSDGAVQKNATSAGGDTQRNTTSAKSSPQEISAGDSFENPSDAIKSSRCDAQELTGASSQDSKTTSSLDPIKPTTPEPVKEPVPDHTKEPSSEPLETPGGGDEVKEGVTSETTTPLTLGHAKDDQIDGVSAQSDGVVQKNATSAGGDTQRNTTSAKSSPQEISAGDSFENPSDAIKSSRCDAQELTGSSSQDSKTTSSLDPIKPTTPEPAKEPVPDHTKEPSSEPLKTPGGGDEVKEGVTSETTTPLTLGQAKDNQVDGVSAQSDGAVQKNTTSPDGDTQKKATSAQKSLPQENLAGDFLKKPRDGIESISFDTQEPEGSSIQNHMKVSLDPIKPTPPKPVKKPVPDPTEEPVPEPLETPGGVGIYRIPMGYWVLFGALVALVAILWPPIQSESPPPQNNVQQNIDIFLKQMEKLNTHFPEQRDELWKRSRIHLQRHLQTAQPTEPVSLILTAGLRAQRTLHCLAMGLATAFSSAINGSVLLMDGAGTASQDSDQVKLDIDGKLQAAFEGNTPVAVIHRFEELPPGSTLIFYRYCDHENAAYKKTFLIFTVLLGEEDIPAKIHLSAVEEMVDDHLQRKFLSHGHAAPASFDKMDRDKYGGLWSRISHLILPVAAEKRIEHEGCEAT